MDKLICKKELLDKMSTAEGANFIYNEKAILEDYAAQTENTSSLPIKVLSIFGGVLATFAFLGFLALTGLYNSETGLLIFAAAFIISAIALNKAFSTLIIDTFSISLYISGFIVLAFGLDTLKTDSNTTLFLITSIAGIALIITQNYIISFISILIISGSFLVLILSNAAYNLIPVYLAFYSVLLTYVFLNEAKLLAGSKKLATLYNPLKTALIFSLLFGLIAIGKRYLIPITPQQLWFSGLSILVVLLYLISVIIKINNVTATKIKVIIYILSVLLLTSTLLSPAISGAFLIILVSVLVHYKTGLAIGILAFIYFIIQYYYDLNFTLLTKSILLMSSGVVFLAFYIFISKKLQSNEKI